MTRADKGKNKAIAVGAITPPPPEVAQSPHPVIPSQITEQQLDTAVLELSRSIALMHSWWIRNHRNWGSRVSSLGKDALSRLACAPRVYPADQESRIRLLDK
jgi:hypothetical protein